jgi:hypothetical protein
MKKIIITFGLIGGAIVSACMLATVPLWRSGSITPANGQLLGYSTMVIALSMVFVGIKNFRDNHNNGFITFGKAFKIGILISVIAAVCYAITWEFTYNFLMPNFMEDMTKYYNEEQIKNGATAEQLAAAKVQMEQLKAWYKNPILRFAMTMVEILPVGLIITVVSAALLRKKNSVQHA